MITQIPQLRIRKSNPRRHDDPGYFLSHLEKLEFDAAEASAAALALATIATRVSVMDASVERSIEVAGSARFVQGSLVLPFSGLPLVELARGLRDAKNVFLLPVGRDEIRVYPRQALDNPFRECWYEIRVRGGEVDAVALIASFTGGFMSFDAGAQDESLTAVRVALDLLGSSGNRLRAEGSSHDS